MKTIVQEGNEWFEYHADGSKTKVGEGSTAPAKEVEQVQEEVKANADGPESTPEPETTKADHSEADKLEGGDE